MCTACTDAHHPSQARSVLEAEYTQCTLLGDFGDFQSLNEFKHCEGMASSASAL